MARINFDDSVEAKKEFEKLVRELGSFRAARGALVEFFRLALKAYGEGVPITLGELEDQDLACMISSGWAVPFEDGFQVKGADVQFAWYRQKVEAGRKGGKSGGRPRKEKAEASEKSGRLVPLSAGSKNTPQSQSQSQSKEDLINTTTSEGEIPDASYELQQKIPTDPLQDFLDRELKPEIRSLWQQVLGADLVSEELPLAALYWMTNPEKRKPNDTFPRFAHSWIQREKKNPKAKPPPPPGSSTQPLKPRQRVEEFVDPETGEKRFRLVPEGPPR